MLESDYPHADSTWPDSQQRLQECVGSFPDAEIAKLTHESAAVLYRFALDPRVQDVDLHHTVR